MQGVCLLLSNSICCSSPAAAGMQRQECSGRNAAAGMQRQECSGRNAAAGMQRRECGLFRDTQAMALTPAQLATAAAD
jgi:hypothetical protein